jgi:hypothetical protein
MKFMIRWSNPTTNNKRPQFLGYETYPLSSMADMLARVEALLGWGYQVSITPPAPRTVEATAAVWE